MQITYGRTCRVVRTENRASPARSIDQSATRVSARRYGAHAAADHHEGSTGTGASVWTTRFLFASSSLSHSTSQELHAHPLFSPFKSQQPRGRKKPNATITPHRTRTTLHISIRMQGNYCPNLILINSLGAQRRQEREALACCSSPLPLLLPVVRPRAFMRGPALPAPRDILLHQPSAAINLAWDSRLA